MSIRLPSESLRRAPIAVTLDALARPARALWHADAPAQKLRAAFRASLKVVAGSLHACNIRIFFCLTTPRDQHNILRVINRQAAG